MAGGERWVWLPEWLEQQELVLERLWEEGQEEAHLQLQRLLRGQEVWCRSCLQPIFGIVSIAANFRQYRQ